MFLIHFLDVGRGDSIILQFENGRTYLIDSNEVTEKTTPLEYLTQVLGVKELETVVVTHPHRDHIIGIQRIIEHIPTRQVWLSGYPWESQIHKNLTLALEQRQDIRVFFPRSGTFIAEGKDRISILAPPANLFRGTHSDINNASIVLKVTIVNQQQDTSTSAILGADAELSSWMQILMEHGRRLKADLLKVSHHGSQYGSDEEVLDVIRPQYAIISVGENLYGHPEASALQIIEEATSVRTFRTDVDGACVFESDGVRFRVK
jgi:competence protein ComEC